MKVLIIVLFTQVILVTHAITIPPFWARNNDKILPNLYFSTTSAPVKKLQSQAPLDSVQHQPKYEHSYPQPFLIYHPLPSYDKAEHHNYETHKPHSYQIIHFDKKNDKVIQQPDVSEHRLINNTTPKQLVENLPEVEEKEFNIKEKSPSDSNNEGSEQYHAPISEHEVPRDIPTKPVYPGPGKWARYGVKHKPYINNQRKTHDNEEDKEEERPKGYDTFEQGEEQFQSEKTKFQHDLDSFPQRHNLGQSAEDISETDSEPLYDKPEIGFIPQKLYAQVRRTETEKHLPRSAIDPEEEENASRLREVIKDSKIHTVYTEEGYEDSAYDHAGHEKNAENSEGNSEVEEHQKKSSEKNDKASREKYADEGYKKRGQDVENRKLQNDEVIKNENYSESDKYRTRKEEAEHDTDVASSEYESKKINPKINSAPIKKIQKVTLKNGEKIDMEIYTEVKYIPGTDQKKHKFIKIFPRQKKINTPNNNSNITTENVSLKRVKRYDKEMLSKRYIRKRPNYYWKKNKTTTEKNSFNARKFRYESSTQPYNKSSSPFVPLSQTATPQIITKSPITTTVSSISTNIDTSTPVTTTSTPYKNKQLASSFKNAGKPPFRPKLPTIHRRKFALKRQKRFTVDHPNIEVDLKEFTDVKKLRLPIPKPDLTHLKYPYYSLPVSDELNMNSPLRYAEDMHNIPIKKSNEMSFYDSRAHIKCPEIETDVNPIPERISNQEEGDETEEMVEELELPRLKGLGDKIDCLKVKYFGENPLDSPFFLEEIINNPFPLFLTDNMSYNTQSNADNTMKVSESYKTKHTGVQYKTEQSKNNINEENDIPEQLNKMQSNKKNILSPEYFLDNEKGISRKTTDTSGAQTQVKHSKKRELKIKILEPIVVIDDELFETATTNPIHQKTNAVLQPPFTLMQMANMNKQITIKHKPKSIYDQIILLENEKEISKSEEQHVAEPEKFLIIYENQDISNLNNYTLENKSNNLSENDFQLTSPDIKIQSSTPTTKLVSKENIRQNTVSAPTGVTERPNVSISTSTQIPVSNSAPPKTLPLIHSPPSKPNNSILYNKLITHRISPYAYIFDISQYLPKITTTRILNTGNSYKRNANPNEQGKLYSEDFHNLNLKTKVNKEKETSPKIIQNQQVVNDMTAESSNIPSLDYSNLPGTTTSAQNQQYQHHRLSKRHVFKKYSETDDHLEENDDDLLMDGTELIKKYVPYRVQGKKSKRDINNAQKNNHPEKEEDLMMMESENLPVYVSPLIKKPKVYTEIVRPKPAKYENDEIKDEEDEGLNPRKRIYELKTPDQIKSEKLREPDRVEVVDEETIEATTTTAAPIIYPVEANSDNQNIAQYIFIIEKLHEKQERDNFTAATTTEIVDFPKSQATQQDTATGPTQIVSESINVHRGEPAYLQIINQLHEIRQENEKHNPTVHDEETSSTNKEVTQQTLPVNSNPFIQKSVMPESFMTELSIMQATLDPKDEQPEKDETDASIRMRNFNAKFKTSINTSKYKTIDRGPVSMRHNFSSRYNSADQDLPLNKSLTTQKPILLETTTTNLETEDAQTVSQHSSNIPTTTQPILDETTYKPTPKLTQSTTFRFRQRTRARSRPTVTTSATTSTHSVDAVTINPVFRRRRPNRVVTSTTETTVITTSTPVHNRRKQRQKFDSQTRSDTRIFNPEHQSNHRNISRSATEIPETGSPLPITTNLPENKKRRTLQKVHERRVMSEVTLTRYYEPASEETDSLPIDSIEETKNAEESKKHQYEVVGPLTHTDTRHGGNYKHEKDTKTNEKKLSNEVHKHIPILPVSGEFYNDPQLALNINHLKEELQSSNDNNDTTDSLPTKKENLKKIVEQQIYSNDNLYPNMARMVNRLAETQTEITTVLPDDIEEEEEEEEMVTASPSLQNPNIIKDPSRRMYFYADV